MVTFDRGNLFDECRGEGSNAYVISHGLCGNHKGVVLNFSATGFEANEQKLEMPLGFQGFVLKLNRRVKRER